MRVHCLNCRFKHLDSDDFPCSACVPSGNWWSQFVPEGHPPHPNYNTLEKKQQEGARRDDATKLRMDLIPPEILTGFSRAATYGVAKYDARNCEKGMAWGRVFGSAMRHLWKFWAGESYDQESGIHHLDMALWNVGMLATYVKRNIGEDDRGPKVRDINFELQFDPEEVEKK